MNEAIKRKIEKLLALGQHQSSDPNEAAAAMAMAQRLMSEHGISEAILHTGSDDDTIISDELYEPSPMPWKGIILHALCKANGCDSLETADKDFKVYGRKGDVQTVSYLYLLCTTRAQVFAERLCKGKGRGYKSSFLLGCASEVAAAIRREHAAALSAARNQYAAQSSALVAIDFYAARAKDAERELLRDYPGIHSTFVKNPIGPGYSAGRAAGQKIYSRASTSISGGSKRLGSGN